MALALALALALAFLCKEYMESIEGNQKQFFSPCQSTAIALNQLKTAESSLLGCFAS